MLLCTSRVVVQFDGHSLVIDNAEARVGRHGSIKAHGSLPLHPHSSPENNSSSSSSSSSGKDRGHNSKASRRSSGMGEEMDGVVIDLANLDLRVSNLYAGL